MIAPKVGFGNLMPNRHEWNSWLSKSSKKKPKNLLQISRKGSVRTPNYLDYGPYVTELIYHGLQNNQNSEIPFYHEICLE